MPRQMCDEHNGIKLCSRHGIQPDLSRLNKTNAVESSLNERMRKKSVHNIRSEVFNTINNSSSFVRERVSDVMTMLMLLISTVKHLKVHFKADKRYTEPHSFYVCIVSLCHRHIAIVLLYRIVFYAVWLLFNVKIMFLSTVFTSAISFTF